MTREKARDAVILAITADIKLALIDKIYDDFESRVCEHCKYYNPNNYDIKEGIADVWIACDKLYIEERDGVSLDGFGCNRFERRT